MPLMGSNLLSDHQNSPYDKLENNSWVFIKLIFILLCFIIQEIGFISLMYTVC